MEILWPLSWRIAGRGGGGGRRRRGRKNRGEENDLGAQAISHRESRLDTSASIIQMTTVNERDPNKSPLNSLGEH